MYQNTEYNPNPNRDNSFCTKAETHTETSYKTDVQRVNLSARKLKNSVINLLAKILKVTPTPSNTNTQELTKHILEFTRKVRLLNYFDRTEDNESLVKK